MKRGVEETADAQHNESDPSSKRKKTTNTRNHKANANRKNVRSKQVESQQKIIEENERTHTKSSTNANIEINDDVSRVE